MIDNLENRKPQPLETRLVRNRATTILRVHHQCLEEGVTTGGTSFDEELETSHDAYGRRLEATSEWQPLDFGWVPASDVGMVVIENLAGRNLPINPTESEREQIADQVIQVCHGGDAHCFEIPPRGADVFRSTEPAALRIRTRGRRTKYRIMVVPR